MIRSLFSRPKQAAIRGVNLYFSSSSVIVAATHQNADGIHDEQPTPVLLHGRPTAEQLGAAFRKAFDDFSVQDKSLREAKRSDWPAFQVSGVRSMKEFEKLFRPMRCYGLNTSNAVVRASVAHPTHDGIELSVSFNPLLGPDVIGGKLLQLADVAAAN
jgi:hypothetical protein